MRILLTGLLALLLTATAATAAEPQDELDDLQAELSQIIAELLANDGLDQTELDELRVDLEAINLRLEALELQLSGQGGGSSSSPAMPPQTRPGMDPEAPVSSPTEASGGSAAAGPVAEEPLDASAAAEDLSADEIPPIDEAGMDGAVEDMPAAAAEEIASEPMPDKDGGGWLPYSDVLRNVSPDGAPWGGWKKDARIDLSWGEYGEIKLDIANAGMTAQWTLQNSFDGNNVDVNVVSGPDGNIIIQVSDEAGRHDFLLTQGGAGQVYRRITKADGSMLSTVEFDEMLADSEAASTDEAASAETETAGEAVSSETAGASTEETAEVAAETGERVQWEARYEASVASGTLQRQPSMDWFVAQAVSGDYRNDALASLGRFLNGDSGEGRSGAIGELSYSVNGNDRIVQFPDPRVDAPEFVNFVGKLYILTQNETAYTISLYY